MVSKVLDASSSSTANVKSWQKTSTDTYADTITNARDMGTARLNYSRLNMVTTLSKNETEDWFSFKTTSRGKLRLTAVNLSDASKSNKESETTASDELEKASEDTNSALEQLKGKGLKVEIYKYVNNRQTLVAANEGGDKKQTEAFEQMMRGEYKNAKPETYYVHVTTKDGKAVKDDTLYALQVQLGDKYTNEYTTQEQSIDHTKMTKADIAKAKAESSVEYTVAAAQTLAAQGASDLLAAGYTNLATIQNSKNQSGVSKLFNLLV